MIDKTYFKEEAAEMGFSLSEEQLAQFDRYAAMLVEWNEKVNLTAILEPREIVVKHFVDSLCLLEHCQLAEGAHLVDIGTGAGFPAIPVKLYRPDLQITMIDSLGKRIRFLESVASELGLT
ncbi:16S rRNA (guanine(527)-N(7))-methyltransferase RsmG, partial [Akkermansia muciniphila]|uniref:16S rRNA (guanine(527)-N(7))-methyltransferase RsmG n=1 Tax=Akkermansia muciniphila TaxID=239935 RepID=UPI00122F944E